MDSATIAVLLLCLFQITEQQQKPVLVTVYYETLCPDSRHFITNELGPIWDKISNGVSIEFVPYGKAHSTSTGIVCQHGPKECRGNLIDSCVLKRLPDENLRVKYVTCRMRESAVDYYTEICAKNVGVNWLDVTSCTNSNEGQLLQLAAGEKTKHDALGPSFVPTIVFNNAFNGQLQSEIERGNFRGVLCTVYKVCA